MSCLPSISGGRRPIRSILAGAKDRKVKYVCWSSADTRKHDWDPFQWRCWDKSSITWRLQMTRRPDWSHLVLLFDSTSASVLWGLNIPSLAKIPIIFSSYFMFYPFSSDQGPVKRFLRVNLCIVLSSSGLGLSPFAFPFFAFTDNWSVCCTLFLVVYCKITRYDWYVHTLGLNNMYLLNRSSTIPHTSRLLIFILLTVNCKVFLP